MVEKGGRGERKGGKEEPAKATKKNRTDRRTRGSMKEGEQVTKKLFGAHVTSGLSCSVVIQVSIYKEGKRRYVCTRCSEEIADPRLQRRPELSGWRIIKTRTTEMVMMEWEKMQIVVQNEKSCLSNEKIINVIRGPATFHVPGGGYV